MSAAEPVPPVPSRDLASALRCAEAAALLAGRVLLEGWGTRPATKSKTAAIDLVTEYDGRAEALVVEELRRAFPDDAIVGEEGARLPGASSSQASWTWYVDPLDGTTNFIHGFPLFCVALGLAYGTRPMLGVVHAPALGWTFVGGEGIPAARNGAPIAVSHATTLEACLLATGFPYAPTPGGSNLPEWADLTGRVHGTRRTGSAALDLCFVACGWFEGYWERHIKPWDLVGGAAIVRAAGGFVTDVDGGPFDGETGRVLATNGHVHEALRAALADIARRAAGHQGTAL